MEEFVPVFETSGGGIFAQRLGSGANQVLSEDLSGPGWLQTGMGFPQDADAVDTTGTDLYGNDYYYQYIRDAMCLMSSGHWNDATYAGVGDVNWKYYRTNTYSSVGFRCAAYPN